MRSVCLDCGPLEAPTAATIDEIARLQLAARRRGFRLELRAEIAREPRQPIPGPNHHPKTFSRPSSHMSYGGMDWVASSRMSDVRAARSYRSNAATYLSSIARSDSVSAGRGSALLTLLWASVPRARWSALVTDATDVSSSSA